MKTRIKYFLLLVFLAAACTSKNTLSIKNKNFDNEIDMRQNLVFTFNRDLVSDSLINLWDTTQFLKITPAVRGKFRWNTKSELMFSPESGFQPATDYSAELTSFIIRLAPLYHLPEEKIISFHTPYLQLTSSRGYWSKASSGPDAVQLIAYMNFNYRVEPSSLANFLNVSIDGKPVQFKMISTTPSDEAAVAIEGFNRTNIKNVKLDIKVQHGMACPGSNYKTKEVLHVVSEIPLPDKLSVEQALGEFEGLQAVIHVYTNQAVDETSLTGAITVSPKIPFTVEAANNGLNIKAAFDPGITYMLTIAKQAKGLLGGFLENDFTTYVPFGQLEPAIAFTSQRGMYLSGKGQRNLGINIVNVPQVEVTIYKIYENNIIQFLDRNQYEYYDYEYEEGYGTSRYNIYGIEKVSDIILQRSYEAPNLPKNGNVQLINIDLDETNDYKGLYLVNVASKNDNWLRATKLIAISDVGLIARQTANEIYVFANSLKSAEPLAGAKINFISSNNQTLYTVNTGPDGVAVFPNIKANAQGFTVDMITALSQGDFTFMRFNDSRVETSRFDVGGRYETEGGYMAFLYGDRDIYRPGETIYMNAVVRTNSWLPAASMPVKLRVLLPNGSEMKNQRFTLNKQGAVSTSIPIAQGAVTGFYTLELYNANDVLLNSRSVSVEEFMPDRIDVKLNTDKPDYNNGDTVEAQIMAVNLFGPPAANRNYEAEFNLSRKSFYAKNYGDYNFSVSISEQSVTFDRMVLQGKTNETGKASASFPVYPTYRDIGMLQGKLYATVFDETGRPVNRIRYFDVYTQEIFYGIKMNDYYANRGERILIPLIAVNRKGVAVTSDAHVQIINYQWYSVIEKSNNGGYHYVSQKKEINVYDKVVRISPQGFTVQYIPNFSGEYEIRVKREGADHYVASNFSAYGYGYTQNTSFEVNPEGQVEMKADKERYTIGENANIIFKTPFTGKLLVTIETDKLLEHYYLTTDKKSARLTIPVKENYLPNVYISATLFKPLDDGSIPLTVAHGYMPLIVDKSENKLPVTISAVERSRSKSVQTIKIKTKPMANIEVTLAVVDEGILQLRNYKTPSPYEFFYQKRALQVNAYDIYPNLLPDLKIKRSSTGGDGYDLSKRVNPLSNKRVQLVALWSGILKTDENGEVSHTITIPQFSGDLRLMACVYHNKAFGSAEKHMKVADPVVISPSIPRFLSPGDTLEMPVTITNTTMQTTIATASLSVDGLLNIIGRDKQNITITSNGEQQVKFRITSAKAIGTGSIVINVNAFNENFSDKTEITVRPITSLLKATQNGAIKGGESKSLDMTTGFSPESSEGKIIVSMSPLVQFSDQLSYLLDYPHGCLEQTTSIAFPQLYYTDLVQNIKNKPKVFFDPNYNVQEAIRKLENMQMYNGALTYWPGGTYENWWGTTYALHFLVEAQKAGFQVNQRIIDNGLRFLAQKVKQRETEDYWCYDRRNRLIRSGYAKREILYSLYILALNGKQDKSTMNYYKANHKLLTIDSRYMLATAYLASGDEKSYRAVLPKAYDNDQSIRSTGGSFYSPIRNEALALNCLMETDPDNPQTGIMAKHLSEQIKKQKWMSTQERSFSFLALGKFVRRVKSFPVNATITANGSMLASFTGKDVVLQGKDILNKTISITTSGSGILYYFTEVSGLRFDNKFTEEDSYLQVRKQFYTRFGQPLGNKVMQGDLVVVKITLFNKEASYIDNIVITDMLPAGFEIENPRLTEQRDMPWIKTQTQPQHFDIRDDRINLFTSISSQPQTFYYMVRAVSTGKFVMGPVAADAMYNGEYHSYNGAGVLTVEER